MKKFLLLFSLLMALVVVAPEVVAQDTTTETTEAPAKKAKKKVRPIEEIVDEMSAKCPEKDPSGSVTESVMIIDNMVYMKERMPIPADQFSALQQAAPQMKPMFLSQLAAANDPEAREFFKALRKSGKGFVFIMAPLEGEESVTLSYTPEEIKAAR